MNINKTIQILSKNTSCKDFGIIINLVNNIIKYIGTNKIIGKYIDKSINILIIIYAILLSNNIYLPLESTYPINKIKHYINNSKCNKSYNAKKIKTRLLAEDRFRKPITKYKYFKGTTMSSIPTELTEKQFEQYVGHYQSKAKRGVVGNYFSFYFSTGLQPFSLPLFYSDVAVCDFIPNTISLSFFSTSRPF